MYGCFNSRTFNKRWVIRLFSKIFLLNLKRGQIVGLVGTNGAGKTSLMKVILGYSIYQEGNFEVIENKHKK